MITAIQAARLEVAGKLKEARTALLETRCSIVWTTKEARELEHIVGLIDELFATIIENKPAPRIDPERDWIRFKS